MSYMLVQKSYVPGSPLESWKLVKFIYSPVSAKRALRTKKFKFSRGDLFALISAEYVSDIDHHVLKLWIATDDQTIVHAPPHVNPPHPDNHKFDWIVEYEQSSARAILNYLYDQNRISYNYLAAVVLECLKAIDHRYTTSHYFKNYVPTFEQWVAIGSSKDDLLELHKVFKVDLNVVSHLAVRGIISDFFLGLVNKNSSFLFDVLNALYTRLPLTTSQDNIVRQLIPLPEFLLLLIEKRTLKLSWE